MTDELRIGLQELLRKAQVEHDADFLRESVRTMSQALMELEVEEHVGASRHERTAERSGQRNGYRNRSWDTRVGTVELEIPRVRDGSYFPSLLEPRRKAERALSAVVQEAYVHGVSTRKVDELVQALGMSGISKSQVSGLCEELDSEVERFRDRELIGSYPYVWLDATYVKSRQDGQVLSTAIVIAIGLNAESGQREVLGVECGSQRRQGVLALFPTFSGCERTVGGEACHQRRSPGSQRGHKSCFAGSGLAAVPGPLHAQRPFECPQRGPADGRSDDSHRLRPARLRERPPAMEASGRRLQDSLSEARRTHGRG